MRLGQLSIPFSPTLPNTHTPTLSFRNAPRNVQRAPTRYTEHNQEVKL